MKFYMEPLISFLMSHWILTSLFVVLLVAVIAYEVYSASLSTSTLPPEMIVNAMNHQEAVVIDIRNAQSFGEGHIVGAHNLPADQLDKKIATLQKFKGKPLIIVCSLGKEATKVAVTLKKQGFQAIVLHGGLQGWRAAGLPIIKK